MTQYTLNTGVLRSRVCWQRVSLNIFLLLSLYWKGDTRILGLFHRSNPASTGPDSPFTSRQQQYV